MIYSEQYKHLIFAEATMMSLPFEQTFAEDQYNGWENLDTKIGQNKLD